MEDPSGNTIAETRRVVKEIYRRARDNAFAHRAAANEAHRSSSFWTMLNVASTVVAGLLTTLTFIAGQQKWQYFDVGFTVASVLLTGLAVGIQCFLLFKKLDAKETVHHYFQGSFQYISQRAREADRPGASLEQVHTLIDDLERDFALLKARAPEPEDRHFVIAAEIQQKRRTDEKYSGALSFPEREPQIEAKACSSSSQGEA